MRIQLLCSDQSESRMVPWVLAKSAQDVCSQPSMIDFRFRWNLLWQYSIAGRRQLASWYIRHSFVFEKKHALAGVFSCYWRESENPWSIGSNSMSLHICGTSTASATYSVRCNKLLGLILYNLVSCFCRWVDPKRSTLLWPPRVLSSCSDQKRFFERQSFCFRYSLLILH